VSRKRWLSVADDDNGVRTSHEQLCQPICSVNDECVAEVLSHRSCLNSETNAVRLTGSRVSESTNDHSSSGTDDVASVDLPDNLQVLFCTTVEKSLT